MKLGHIDYLNCYPFYFHALEREPLRGVRIISDYPSELNRMMRQGLLDMSPVSSATCADIMDEVFVLPEFCLSSIGYVGSVILSSRVPIEDLHHRTVGITRASHTSAVLLKVLFKNYYRLEPHYVTTAPRPALRDMDAALIIGNDAMVRSPGLPAYTYDLGDLWLRKTGFPVVFAVFAVREEALEKYAPRIKSVISSYRLSLRCLEQEKDFVIMKAKQRYPDIIYDIDSYYDLLEFELNDALKQALLFYYSAAADLGLVKRVEKVRYLTEEILAKAEYAC